MMDSITLTLGPAPPPPPCRHCGEPAAVEIRSAGRKGPGGAVREMLQVYPLLLCRECYPERVTLYLRRLPREFGATLEVLAVSLDVVVRGVDVRPWTGPTVTLPAFPLP